MVIIVIVTIGNHKYQRVHGLIGKNTYINEAATAIKYFTVFSYDIGNDTWCMGSHDLTITSSYHTFFIGISVTEVVKIELPWLNLLVEEM